MPAEGSARHGFRPGNRLTDLLVAFVGGLVSFVSPCVWPLYPAYIAQVAATQRGRTLLAAALFTVGFTAVFVGFGLSASALGTWLRTYQLPLQKAGGMLILLLGLTVSGILPERLLGGPRGVNWKAPGTGPLAALAMGAAFAVGWTPCVGPVLASILVLAGTSGGTAAGAGLLLAYSAGFAAPFLLFSAVAARSPNLLPRLGPTLPWLRRISGLGLAALGVLVFTGQLQSLSTYLFNRL